MVSTSTVFELESLRDPLGVKPDAGLAPDDHRRGAERSTGERANGLPWVGEVVDTDVVEFDAAGAKELLRQIARDSVVAAVDDDAHRGPRGTGTWVRFIVARRPG